MTVPATTLLDVTKASAVQPGLAPETAVLLAKALRVMARKLDRDGGVTDTDFEALTDAVTAGSDPVALVP